MLLRKLKFFVLHYSRRFSGQDKKSLVYRLLRSKLMRWEQQTVCCGVAVGLFWAFIPMPFQMVPATMFCWLLGGNLPLAILCVWITNPITVGPILYFEYLLGQWLQSHWPVMDAVGLVSFAQVLSESILTLYIGGLALALIAMLSGYLIAQAIFLLVSDQIRLSLGWKARDRLRMRAVLASWKKKE